MTTNDTNFHEHVYDADYAGGIHLDADGHDSLVLTADEGPEGSAVTVTFDANGVRKLRLALSRYERAQKVSR